MIVIDSSGWLEFLTDGPLADEYAKRLRSPDAVITPTIVMYEVYKHSKRLRGEASALDAVAAMQKTHVVPLNDELAPVAADRPDNCSKRTSSRAMWISTACRA